LSKDRIGLDDPITKFIPGLNQEYYGDVTIKSLTDHTSGLGRFVRPPLLHSPIHTLN